MAVPSIRVAVDIGGTFTDVAAFDDRTGSLMWGKNLSTPDALEEGVRSGVRLAALAIEDAALFLHGSTVAINTLLERSGATTALFTTQGFRDVYEIGRINRPDSYNLFFKKHDPLVPRERRYEVTERLGSDGEVLIALDDAEVISLADRAVAAGVNSIAISYINSYRNASHESRTAQVIADRFPALFVTASSEVSREYREFERTSTCAANAYIGPRVRSYLSRLEAFLEADGFGGTFLVLQSNGGLYDVEQAKRECVRMLESGPSGGVIGTKAICDALAIPRAISFDMGGTTAKAGVVEDGQPVMTGLTMVGGYNQGLPIQMSMIDIHEVGTGGGSIARTGAGGALRVGPESAGAEPGPACYGFGGSKPTVTDANVLLSRLDPETSLAGGVPIDIAAARLAIRSGVADPLALDEITAAAGILRIAVTSMAHAVSAVTTQRGKDVRDFTLVAFGGAGPLHATQVARELRIARVIVPVSPGHFSALGMLLSDMRRDFVRTLIAPLETVDLGEVETTFREMEVEAVHRLEATGAASSSIDISRSADMRYIGQEHSVTVPLPQGPLEESQRLEITRRFDEAHEQRYGFASPGENCEVVSVRSEVTAALTKPAWPVLQEASTPLSDRAETGKRDVFLGESGWVQCPVYSRAGLQAGDIVPGPAVIEEEASTTLLLDGDVAEVHPYGHLMIETGT